MRKNEKGITLIALVITIIVLIILAAISIATLTGENGLLTKAGNAKEQTAIGEEKEYINLAYTAAKLNKIANGDKSDVTKDEMQTEINKYTNKATVTVAGTGILKITYTSGRAYEIDASGNIINNGSYDGMYSVSDLEGKIAPQDLFEYEIIDEGAKTARIVRIKPEYFNLNGYNPHTETYDLTNTDGDIIYNGQKISDMLVIPYEMEQNGVKYKIIEANIKAEKKDYIGSGTQGIYASYPNVDNVIYPNSIISINPPFYQNANRSYEANGVKTIVLSNNLKEIPKGAFEGCSSLTSITIPNGVTSIENNTFADCSSLISITIPESVTNIGDYSFHYCENLTEIIIPEAVTYIGRYAFEGCSNLESMTCESNEVYIGDRAFGFTPWLNNQPNGELYISNVFYKYVGSMPANTSIILKEGTTQIADYAFNYCANLTNITIPDSVKSIGYRAFYECDNLTNITIPEGITTIEYMTFEGCNKLTSVTIPESLTSIGESAFEGCSRLTSITIPDSVTTIGNSAFEGCDGLTSITITNKDTIIGSRAFYECDGLKNIKIAGSIGREAFYGCGNLETVEISDSLIDIADDAFDYTPWLSNHPSGDLYINNIYYKYIGKMPENTSITIKNGTTRIVQSAFEDQTGLISITIPDGVTSIEDYTFSGCSNLASVTLPDTVTSLNWYAFEGCTSLTSITIPESVTSIDKYAFEDCTSLTSINIKKGKDSISDAPWGATSATVNWNYTGE